MLSRQLVDDCGRLWTAATARPRVRARAPARVVSKCRLLNIDGRAEIKMAQRRNRCRRRRSGRRVQSARAPFPVAQARGAVVVAVGDDDERARRNAPPTSERAFASVR